MASVNPGACSPFNPFGLNQASAAAQDFIGATTTRIDVLEQEVLTASLVSDTSSFFNLQCGAFETYSIKCLLAMSITLRMTLLAVARSLV